MANRQIASERHPPKQIPSSTTFAANAMITLRGVEKSKDSVCDCCGILPASSHRDVRLIP